MDFELEQLEQEKAEREQALADKHEQTLLEMDPEIESIESTCISMYMSVDMQTYKVLFLAPLQLSSMYYWPSFRRQRRASTPVCRYMQTHGDTCLLPVCTPTPTHT